MQALIYLNITCVTHQMKVDRQEGEDKEAEKSNCMWKTKAENRQSCREKGREDSGKTRA